MQTSKTDILFVCKMADLFFSDYQQKTKKVKTYQDSFCKYFLQPSKALNNNARYIVLLMILTVYIRYSFAFI